MPYIPTLNRTQLMMYSLDSLVEKDSTARLIDAFVDSLDLSQFNIKQMSCEGRPAYNPKGLFKLYIYGSVEGIRSSRKLAKSCKINNEVIWLLGGLTPDFRTIANFRKDNIDAIKSLFYELFLRLHSYFKNYFRL